MLWPGQGIIGRGTKQTKKEEEVTGTKSRCFPSLKERHNKILKFGSNIILWIGRNFVEDHFKVIRSTIMVKTFVSI